MAQGALARARAPIRIPENEPEHAVITEHSAHLAEDLDQGGDILFGRRLETDLSRAALIITQLKIGRAGDHALDGSIPQWNCSRIATDDHRVSSCRPRPGAKGAGRFFPPPCGRRGACAKTTASDFVTRRGRFCPARREMCAAICLAWGRASTYEGGRMALPDDVARMGGRWGEEQDEKLRRAGRAPASRAGTDAGRAGRADQGAQRKAGVAEADHGYRARSLRRAAGSGAEADRARAKALP